MGEVLLESWPREVLAEEQEVLREEFARAGSSRALRKLEEKLSSGS